jgi:hypothetical protein
MTILLLLALQYLVPYSHITVKLATVCVPPNCGHWSVKNLAASEGRGDRIVCSKHDLFIAIHQVQVLLSKRSKERHLRWP